MIPAMASGLFWTVPAEGEQSYNFIQAIQVAFDLTL